MVRRNPNDDQRGLFDATELSNAAAKQVWKKREVDRLLDFYLSGADLGRIAVSLQRNRKAIVRKLQEYIYNERDRVTNYQPRQRTSRAGKHLTPNERQLITECRKKKVPDARIAAVLARPETDLDTERPLEKVKAQNAAPFAPSLDLFLAHRYARLKWQEKFASDEVYKQMEYEETEYGAGRSALEKFGSVDTMPHRIIYLALYLSTKVEDDKKREQLKELFPPRK